MGVWVTVVLIGAIALPSLARKKKVQPVGQQQQTVRVDSLSPNNRKRYDYFLTEAARQLFCRLRSLRTRPEHRS